MSQEPEPGTRIDDFTVAYRISRGMSADVLAVWHHHLRAPLVCKRLRAADRHDPKWRRLLRAEGMALATLNHPGIVRLVSRNFRAELPYLLFEHVGSKTLRDLLREEGPFEVGRALPLVQNVGAAVAYAHELGYIHRDLKPSNIILREGRPVLLDFGVVWKWKAGRRPTDRSGTPQYLAPEQILREPLTPRTDVYGLGALLFELLTGARPFPAGDAHGDRRAPLADRYPQLIRDALTLELAGRPHAPAGLQPVLARAMARSPEERFASVDELLLALDPFTETKIWPREALDARGAFTGER